MSAGFFWLLKLPLARSAGTATGGNLCVHGTSTPLLSMSMILTSYMLQRTGHMDRSLLQSIRGPKVQMHMNRIEECPTEMMQDMIQRHVLHE